MPFVLFNSVLISSSTKVQYTCTTFYYVTVACWTCGLLPAVSHHMLHSFHWLALSPADLPSKLSSPCVTPGTQPLSPGNICLAWQFDSWESQPVFTLLYHQTLTLHWQVREFSYTFFLYWVATERFSDLPNWRATHTESISTVWEPVSTSQLCC